MSVLSKLFGYHRIALAAAVSLFTAPYLHDHDLALLVIVLLGLILAGIKLGRLTIRTAATLPVLASLVFLTGEFVDAIRLDFPYLFIAFLPGVACRVESLHGNNYFPASP